MRPDGLTTFTLPLDAVREDKNFTLRIFYGDLDLLAVQLMTEGQLEPIKVRHQGEHFLLVDGHRRHRALARCRQLRIARAGGRHLAFEGEQALREAPGPLHAAFDPGRVQCRLLEPGTAEAEVFATQMTPGSGLAFTLLERMIFVSRLSRLGRYTREELALKAGFSLAQVARALNLSSADPRLFDYVRDGRIAADLALRLLRAFPAEQQMVNVAAALAAAQRHHRDRILAKDFDWGKEAINGRLRALPEKPIDPVRARMQDLACRLGEAQRFAPNPAASDRLGTLLLVQRYATGKLSYAKLEAHLMGRE